MRRLLARVLLVLLLLAAGGVVLAEDHGPGRGTVLSQFSLLALIEAHEPGNDAALEHHPVCADCTGFATVVGLVAPLSFAAPVVTAHRWPRSRLVAVAPLAFAPAAPPPR